jgi:2-hydroxy-6-oxonona-2,4-dienedioate hydrolase
VTDPSTDDLSEAAVAWSRSRHVTVGDWRIRYREAGGGTRIVVLVHGLGVSADYWIRNGPALAAAGCRVLAPDLPGFGRSTGDEADVGVAAQARMLAEWAAALDLGPAVYVGHSVSCQSVVELAGAEPARVVGLVLAAPTQGTRAPAIWHEAARFARDAFREPLRLYPVIGEAYLRAGPVRWVRTWRAARRHDLHAAARRVRVPCVVLLGTRDPVVTHPEAGALTAALRNARLQMLEGGTHALIYTAADAFNRAVLDHVRALTV